MLMRVDPPSKDGNSYPSPVTLLSGADIDLNRIERRSEVPAKKAITSRQRKEALRSITLDFVTKWNDRVDHYRTIDHSGAWNVRRLSFRNDFTNFERAYTDDIVARCIDGAMHKGVGYAGYDDTVETALRVLMGVLQPNGALPHVAVTQPPQSGKTAIMHIVLMLYLMHCDADGRTSMCNIIPYGNRAPTEETRNDYIHIRAVYANLCIEGAEDTLFEIVGSLEHEDHKNIVLRNRASQVRNGTIAPAIDRAVSEVLLLLDEADHASGHNSVLSVIMAETSALYESHGINVRWVCFSATGWEFTDLHCFEHIDTPKKPGSGYVGIVQGDPLNVRSLTEVGKALDIRNLVADFHVVQNGSRRLKDVCTLMLSLFKGADAPEIGLNGRPLNDGRALVVRYGDGLVTDLLVTEFEKRLTKRKDIKVIRYYGRQSLTNTVTKTVRDALKDDPSRMLLIVLKGAGRRADRFPEECTVFLDFTHRYSTAEALYQGILGRASGYKGRNGFVMVSDLNKAEVDEMREHYRLNNKDSSRLRYTRAVRCGQHHRVRTISQWVLDKTSCSTTVWKRVAQAMGSLTNGHLTLIKDGYIKYDQFGNIVGSRDGKTPPLLRFRRSDVNGKHVRHKADGNKVYFDFNYILGGAANIRAIETSLRTKTKNPDIKILRPGAQTFDRFLESNGNFTNISVTRFGATGHQGGPDGSSRDNRRQDTDIGRTPGKGLMMDFKFREITGSVISSEQKFELMSVLLFFDQPYADSSLVDGSAEVTLPGKSSVYHMHTSAEERLEIESARVLRAADANA